MKVTKVEFVKYFSRIKAGLSKQLEVLGRILDAKIFQRISAALIIMAMIFVAYMGIASVVERLPMYSGRPKFTNTETEQKILLKPSVKSAKYAYKNQTVAGVYVVFTIKNDTDSAISLGQSDILLRRVGNDTVSAMDPFSYTIEAKSNGTTEYTLLFPQNPTDKAPTELFISKNAGRITGSFSFADNGITIVADDYSQVVPTPTTDLSAYNEEQRSILTQIGDYITRNQKKTVTLSKSGLTISLPKNAQVSAVTQKIIIEKDQYYGDSEYTSDNRAKCNPISETGEIQSKEVACQYDHITYEFSSKNRAFRAADTIDIYRNQFPTELTTQNGNDDSAPTVQRMKIFGKEREVIITADDEYYVVVNIEKGKTIVIARSIGGATPLNFSVSTSIDYLDEIFSKIVFEVAE